MNGIMIFEPPKSFVGKKKEYLTKQDFIEGIKEEFGKEVKLNNVNDGYVRYYPKGTEDSEFNFGRGVGIYQFVGVKGKGVSEVWVVGIDKE